MTHKCLATGCTKEISLAYLMCRGHWYQVPKEIQKAIWRTLGDRDRTEYLEHVRAAVEAIDKIEGRQLELRDLEKA